MSVPTNHEKPFGSEERKKRPVKSPPDRRPEDGKNVAFGQTQSLEVLKLIEAHRWAHRWVRVFRNGVHAFRRP